MIRVGFDVHHLVRPYTGNGRYTESLLSNLTRLYGERDAHFIAYGWPKNVRSEVLSSIERRSLLLNRIGRYVLETPFYGLLDGLDIYHSQYSLPTQMRARKCLSIHDTAFARKGTPDYSLLKTIGIEHFASKADAIITLTESTRSDLERLFHSSRPPIYVVPAGTDMKEPSQEELRLVEALISGLEPPFIVYVGRMAARKRIPLLIDGFALYRQRRGGTLLLIGPDDDDSDRISLLIKGHRNIVRLGGVSEGAKTAILRSANLFVYLSEYEGFGIPIVEAMASGVPVITSDASALVEVGGGATTIVGARKQEVAEAIDYCLSNPQTDIITRGLLVAQRYSWSNSSRLTMSVYRRILG